MKDQTGTRLGLVVVLAFLVAFGLILTTQSNRYEVSPATASIQGSGEAEARGHPISRASLGEATAREWQRRRPVPRRSRRAVEADRSVPARQSSSVDPSDEDPSSRHADPHRRRAQPPVITGPRSRPATEAPVESRPAVPQIPNPHESGPKRAGGGSKPATGAPKPPVRAPKSPERETRPEELRPPGELPDSGVRTARGDPPANSRFVGAEPEEIRATPAVYVIKPRDNLIRICKAVYGTSDHRVVQALYEANRDRLKNKNHVMVGQRLRIPAWPQNRTKHIPRRVPLSQRAVVPARTPGGIKLPVLPVDRRSAGQRRANEVAAGSSDPGRKVTSSRGRTKERSTRAQRYRWHRVKRNESLSTIARDKLGNGRRWGEIWKLNKGRLRRPNHLPKGFRIKVPLAVPARGRPMLAAERDETPAEAL